MDPIFQVEGCHLGSKPTLEGLGQRGVKMEQWSRAGVSIPTMSLVAKDSHPLSCSACSGDCVPKEASPSPRGDLPKSKREILSICRASRKLSRFHKHHICIQCALRLYLTWQEILVFRTSVFQSVESSLQKAPQLCISKCPKGNGGKTGVKTMAS